MAYTETEREAAILSVRLWTAERNWSLSQCADALGIGIPTLKHWMRTAGFRHQVKAAVWLPVSDGLAGSDLPDAMREGGEG